MKLLALRCPVCNQPLTPENDHIVVACAQCHTAVHIGDDGPEPVDVHYAAPVTGATVTHWLPFWVFHGRVHITRRDTQGRGTSEQAAAQFWEQPRHLYVPAWELSLQVTQQMGSAMIQRQPLTQPLLKPAAGRLLPVTLTVDDARKMLEFIVLAIEARREDWLKRLEFRLELEPPALWAFPSDNKGPMALG
jgi:hypothetical protein